MTVSVIIPTYNRGELVLEAIESALNQTYKDVEVIVSDDGSTDGTDELVKNTFGNRVVLIKGNHRGVSHARNEAIKIARGEYIAFLDDDDWWDKRFLEKTVGRLEKGDVIGVFTNYYKVYSNGMREYGYKKGRVPPIVGLNWIIRGSFIDPSNTVVKTEVISEAGLFDESLDTAEDWDLWLRMMKFGEFAYIDECLVYKRVNLDYNIPWKRWMNNCRVLDKIIDGLGKDEFKKIETELRESASKVYSRWGSYLLHIGNMNEARKFLLKSLDMKFRFKTAVRYAATYLPLGVARLFDGIYLRELKERSKMKRLSVEGKR